MLSLVTTKSKLLMKFDKVFMTSSPSFYKNRLFTEISMHIKICVIFTGAAYHQRNADFYRGEQSFKNITLPKGFRNQIKVINSFLNENEFDEIIFGGWDTKITWYTILRTPKSKNSCIFESSINESGITGAKGLIKKIFLSRLHKAYPSGILQAELLTTLKFKGDIVEYGGCGILNYQPQPAYEERNYVKNFIFVGRLVPVKNLQMLISVFNKLPQFTLTIVGFGPLEAELKELANENIKFTGAIDNIELPKYYKNADVFLLASYSEPWGLVVEEALNNGIPVIVSDHVGCHKDLVTSETGLVFKSNNETDLMKAVLKICDIKLYNKLREGVSKLDFSARAERQVNSFLK